MQKPIEWMIAVKLERAHRIEIAWILHHAYQSRGLECVQFGGLTVEIHLGGTFDAHGIMTACAPCR